MPVKIQIPEYAKIAMKTLNENGFEAFVVGGCVRDSIMGKNANDWDMTTSAEPTETLEVFKDFRTIPTGIKHGTITVLIDKQPLEKKLFGVFEHKADYKRSMLLRGFDDRFMVPHSRHTTIDDDKVKSCKKLKVLASSKKAGIYALATKNGKQIFITGHSEYDAETLANEYFRDLGQGKPIDIPENYFPDNNPDKKPIVSWRSHANLLYSNWLNYIVYQTTPYDLNEIK